MTDLENAIKGSSPKYQEPQQPLLHALHIGLLSPSPHPASQSSCPGRLISLPCPLLPSHSLGALGFLLPQVGAHTDTDTNHAHSH